MKNLLKINLKKYFTLGYYTKKVNPSKNKIESKYELFKKFLNEKKNRFELGSRYPSSQESDYYYKWFNSSIPNMVEIINRGEKAKILQIDKDQAQKAKEKLNKIIEDNKQNDILNQYFKANQERRFSGNDEISEDERLLLLQWIKSNVKPIVEILDETNNLPIEYVYPLNKPSDEIRRIIARHNFQSMVNLNKQSKLLDKTC